MHGYFTIQIHCTSALPINWKLTSTFLKVPIVLKTGTARRAAERTCDWVFAHVARQRTFEEEWLGTVVTDVWLRTLGMVISDVFTETGLAFEGTVALRTGVGFIVILRMSPEVSGQGREKRVRLRTEWTFVWSGPFMGCLYVLLEKKTQQYQLWHYENIKDQNTNLKCFKMLCNACFKEERIALGMCGTAGTRNSGQLRFFNKRHTYRCGKAFAMRWNLHSIINLYKQKFTSKSKLGFEGT